MSEVKTSIDIRKTGLLLPNLTSRIQPLHAEVNVTVKISNMSHVVCFGMDNIAILLKI